MKRIFSVFTGSALVLSMCASAAPIRVLIFNTCGPSGYLHNISQQTPQIKKILLNPAAANLQNPVIPVDGFVVDSLGSATQNGTTTDGHNLILALATHDVVVCANNTAFTSLFTTTDQKAFLDWAQGKGHGVVAYHGAADDNGNWPEKIAYFGGKLTTHTAGIATLLADSTPANVADANWQAINAGLGKSYSIKDEWYSYQAQPRDLPGIKILSTLDEASYDPAKKMGDHPISWYRAPVGGGRLYYTGAGHDWTYWRDTYWLRRQFYNAIVWASGYTAPATAIESKPAQEPRNGSSRISGTSLTVSVDRDGPHSIEIRSLDGKRVAMERGVGKRSHTFAILRSNAVYAVLVSTPSGTTGQLIKTR